MYDSNDTQDCPPGGPLTRRQFVGDALKLGLCTGGSALLAGCFSSKPKAAPPSKLTGRVQILIGFAGGNTAGQRQVQQAMAEAFINAHPQVGIDFLRATSTDAATTELTTLIARGQAPDIVLGIGLADLSRLVDQGLWLDLEPFMQADGVSSGLFVPPARTAAALSTYYGGTTKVPALPIGIHDHALAYNPGLLTRAGVAAPPASWSQSSWSYTGAFLNAAQRLTLDAAGHNALDPKFDAGHIVQFGTARILPEVILYSFAGHLYDASKHQATVATSGAVAGAQFAADLVSRYHVQPSDAQLAALGGTGPAASSTGDPALAAWRAGKLAMIDLCSCEIASGYAMDLPFPVKVAALPTGPARRYCRLESTLAALVAAGSRHQLAWEVLKFLVVGTSNERQLAYDGFGTMPALAANLATFGPATQRATGVDPAVWLAGIPSASAEIDAWTPAFADVQSAITSGLAKVAAGTSAAVVMPQVQAQAQSQINGWLKAHKLP